MPARTLNDISSLIDALTKQHLPRFESEECVSLLTAHASKGLEFDYIFIVDCDNTHFPYKHFNQQNNNENDELKLLYVALTRSKKSLNITFVKNSKHKATKYLKEMNNNQLIECHRR